MRVRPLITLIAAGTATAVLSTACGSDPIGPSPPGPPMFTTIDGVVRFMNPWVDSIPVPGVVVRAMETTRTYNGDGYPTSSTIEVASVRADSNGAYSLSFTASCDGSGRIHTQTFSYRLAVGVYQVSTLEPGDTGRIRMLTGVCDIPAIQYDLWVWPE